MHLTGLRQPYLARYKDKYHSLFPFEWIPIAISASGTDRLLVDNSAHKACCL